MDFVKRYWKLFAKVAASAALLWMVFRAFGSERTAALLQSADYRLFAAACLAMAAAFAANAARWWLVSHETGFPISPWVAGVGTAEAAFFNQILPTGIGGDAMRVVRAFDHGLATGWAIIGVTIDRALGLLAVAVSMLAYFALRPGELAHGGIFTVLFAASLVVAAGALVAAGIGVLPLARWAPRWAKGFAMLFVAYSRIMRRPRFVVVATTLLAGAIFFYTWAFVLCARALGMEAGWAALFVVIQGIALAALIPLSIGGWGVREGAAVLLFAPFGVAPDQGLAVSVLFGLALTVIGLFGGVTWIAAGYRKVDTSLPDNP